MVTAAILFLPFVNWTGLFRAKLDYFTQKKIFYDYLNLKWSRLVDHLKTGQICWFSNGPVLGCPVPAEIDHSNSMVLVR
jgi:hypothetical protein